MHSAERIQRRRIRLNNHLAGFLARFRLIFLENVLRGRRMLGVLIPERFATAIEAVETQISGSGLYFGPGTEDAAVDDACWPRTEEKEAVGDPPVAKRFLHERIFRHAIEKRESK